jgi:glycosyltransferase involved in cell wall biosynthesis
VLRRVFAWPSLFLYTGQANHDYYRAFGVPESRLRLCPHGTDVARFAQPHEAWEAQARSWRAELGFGQQHRVVLFAGKFEPNKRPLELMQRILDDTSHSVVMVGAGELDAQVRKLAATHPTRCRVLPFQNQRRMPAVYRLGDVVVLPSLGETWGFAVTEALACGRPVVASDRVGCAADVATPPYGAIFPWEDLSAMISAIERMLACEDLPKLRQCALERAWQFDVSRTEATLLAAIREAVHDR